MIIQAADSSTVSDILRDLKTFTAKAIIQKLSDDNLERYAENLTKFVVAGKPLKRIKFYKVWRDGNQAKLLYSNKFILEKLNYIHYNQVKYGLCDKEWNYKFSPATNYADMPSLLEVILLSLW